MLLYLITNSEQLVNLVLNLIGSYSNKHSSYFKILELNITSDTQFNHDQKKQNILPSWSRSGLFPGCSGRKDFRRSQDYFHRPCFSSHMSCVESIELPDHLIDRKAKIISVLSVLPPLATI